MGRSNKPEWQRKIAKERIEILLGLAKKENKNKERSRRYVQLARKIGTRYVVRLSTEQKRSFCKRCDSIIIGKSSKCASCGANFAWRRTKERLKKSCAV